MACGMPVCWTLARIAELVRRRFKVEYTLAGLELLFHRFGWSVQVPARQAAEHDEAAIAGYRSGHDHLSGHRPSTRTHSPGTGRQSS